MSLSAATASDATLDAAFAWLCKRRQDYPDHADVWAFRRDWPQDKACLQSDLRAGRYRFGLLSRVELAGREEIDLWSARDALVLKALTLALQPILPASRSCVHLRGHGGAKAAVRQIMAKLTDNCFVLKTDVRSYYASIDHHLLLDRLAAHIADKGVLNLIGQYLRRTAERGGEFFDHERGISLGCPLSPLIGAFFLDELDRRMARSGLFYVRFMDDILVLAPSRWKLRRAVKVVNEVLASLRLEKHPDKTFIGRIEKGFDFLGYHFGPQGLAMAEKTIAAFVERALRLYEQDREEPSSPSRFGVYVRRWVGWSTGGLQSNVPEKQKRIVSCSATGRPLSRKATAR